MGRKARDSASAIGRRAEDSAAAWLSGRGWTVVARNWKAGPGELDIVARKGIELAFVEVKAVDAWGSETLSRSVGPEKRRRIVETSKLFLCTYREFSCMNVRYDVLAMKAGNVELYLERAFAERT